jgi:hypothetical protein
MVVFSHGTGITCIWRPGSAGRSWARVLSHVQVQRYEEMETLMVVARCAFCDFVDATGAYAKHIQ